MHNQNHLDQQCINTIRMLAVDAVERANSGHPGMPMGAAPMAYVLWTRFLRHSPLNSDWPDRDRFVLSAGHGSMLLYSLLHLTGYNLTLADLKNFRQWQSRTPGHPELCKKTGIETTTGPLGQGFANGVGMAMAEQHLAALFNRPGHEIVNHYTYGMVSDGDLMEGISHEAASLAGHLQLGKLICLYDDNRISIEGHTDLAYTEDRLQRFTAYGWQVQVVEDGNDLAAIEKALQAGREEKGRPSLIAVRTKIGFGSPNRQDTSSAHGEPLGAEEIQKTRKNLDWPMAGDFIISAEAANHFRRAVDLGLQMENDWTDRLRAYHNDFPELAAEFEQRLKGDLPAGWDREIPFFEADPKGKATRVVSGQVLNAIAARVPALMGGSADLAPSTKTIITGDKDFLPGSYDGRNIHFGVRELGMGGILNGMALHGGFIPYGATFLVFSDYMRPAIRLASLMNLQVIYVLTHDSIGLGEDGPTHQPIEHLASLRAMPGLTVIRPADANETAAAWKLALQARKNPTVLALSRQALPTLDRSRYQGVDGVACGAYILNPEEVNPDVLLLASGSEVHIILAAAENLGRRSIAARVISMPSWEIFDRQPESYRNSILPPTIKCRVAMEAGATMGWERYVGESGTIIGLDRFGASAPIEDLYNNFGLTAKHVEEAAIALLKTDRA